MIKQKHMDADFIDAAARVAIDGADDTPLRLSQLAEMVPSWPFGRAKTTRLIQSGEMKALWISGKPYVSRRLLREFLEAATYAVGDGKADRNPTRKATR